MFLLFLFWKWGCIRSILVYFDKFVAIIFVHTLSIGDITLINIRHWIIIFFNQQLDLRLCEYKCHPPIAVPYHISFLWFVQWKDCTASINWWYVVPSIISVKCILMSHVGSAQSNLSLLLPNYFCKPKQDLRPWQRQMNHSHPIFIV